MADDIQVTNGVLQNPYKEFSFTLAAGASDRVKYDHSCLRVLSVSGGSLQMRFGQNAEFTSIIGGGLGFSYNDAAGNPIAIRDVQLKNSHASESMTVTVGVAMGEIRDDRLAISSAVTVTNTEATAIWTNEEAPDNAAHNQVSVTNAATLIKAAVATRKSCLVEAGTIDLFIGTTNSVTAANGYRIPAGGSVSIPWRGTIYGIRAAGTANASYWEEYN